ncbi:hypothetical protein [Streptomyces sp. CB02400]|uniref:hypothetical protein n=1 Tax=Streptomyces sp. CB02400 TaxID=1703944 RepID=UPI0009404967|nr:hypothetical protein [Streptomyces sp. CB02400]OKK03052.1 hypothetical protein AMK33_25805 [Streptomyces sp. CB02400]
MPYDPPSRAARMNGSAQGNAAYKVADRVAGRQAYGLSHPDVRDGGKATSGESVLVPYAGPVPTTAPDAVARTHAMFLRAEDGCGSHHFTA